MFEHSAEIYDALYAFKDYPAEVAVLVALFEKYGKGLGSTILDVACGTGKHIEHLKDRYAIEGLDLDSQLLTIASERNPGVPFHQQDMCQFQLGKTFDIVLCLFSAIGYAKTTDRLESSIQCMASHLSTNGLLIIEPWLTPESYIEGNVHSRFVDEPVLKAARINVSKVENGLSILDMHYLVGSPTGVEYYQERHELGLFTDAQYCQALRKAGLKDDYDPQGLMDRGLYIGHY